MAEHDDPDRYRTVAAALEHEPAKTRGSRHIANVFPVQNADQIAAALASVKGRMPDATHHAWAWRLGRGPNEFRYSDDGEPSGSAGRPILQQIDGRHVTDVLVVVTRYFGGTKLGVGGLVRAYGGAAADALERAAIVEVVPHATVRIAHAYEDSGVIAGVLRAWHVIPAQSEYGAEVRIEVAVPQARVAAFVDAVRDATAARARIDVEPPERA